MRSVFNRIGTFGILLKLCIIGFSFLSFSSSERTSATVIDEEIMVPVPDSELYVRIRGNKENPLIINLHGGPGGYSGIDIKLMGPALEDRFLIAYLDQRGCGKSLASQDPARLNVAQYIEDLDIVVDNLMSKYNKKSVNLMGTSWGGMYGFLYMLEHQDKVQSYACIDGKVNSHYQNHSLIDFEMKRSKEILDTTVSTAKRKELEFIISELARIKTSDFADFHKDVNWMKHEVPPILGFNAYFADTSKVISFSDVVNDPALMNLMKYTPDEYAAIAEKAETVNRAFRNNPDYNNINIESDLAKIKTPTGVIQGDRDYVVGLEHADLIYKALTGLSEKNKEIHIIPNTGHSPAIESPEKLTSILTSFFSKHN
ncbi:MAG: alpha/beta hydrolase [Christiangramia sp.]|nr:alpha/beta hydrolase [Christiangramia sp.]